MARALEAAGHEVVWAIAPEAVSSIESLGMRARAAGLDRSEVVARTAAGWPALFEQFFEAAPRDRRLVVFPVMFAAVQAPPMLHDLRVIVDEWRPDVVVHEPNEAAAAPIAAARGIPHVVVGFGGFQPAELMTAAEEALRELWGIEGLDLPPSAGLYDYLYLHQFPPSFGPTPFVESIRPLRPMLFDGVDSAESPGWLERLGVSRPCVYATFGTEIANLAPIGIVADAFADIDVDAVMTVGHDLDPDSIKPPPNVRIEQYVPQRLVLARSSLLVSHAGSGAVLGAAARGISQLCLPIAADQFENADVVAASGCGLSIDPRDVQIDSVHDSIRRLLNDESFTTSARSIANEILAMPDPPAVVPMIETVEP